MYAEVDNKCPKTCLERWYSICPEVGARVGGFLWDGMLC